METKEQLVSGYKALQAEWKRNDHELLLVGRLAYWTHWLSKLAETSKNLEMKNELFNLKKNGLALLGKSEYVQIRKYVPVQHKRLCYSHFIKMRRNNINIHKYLARNEEKLISCTRCQYGVEHYYSLYSVAVLNNKEGVEGRKPLFILYCPYIALQNEFPPLDSLESVKRYSGVELGTLDISQTTYNNKINTEAFSKELVLKYFTKNYNNLEKYLNSTKLETIKQ